MSATPLTLLRGILSYFLAFFLIGLSHWIAVSFDSPTIDQILYHLHYSEGLGLDIGRVFLFTFIAECIVFPALFAAGAVALHAVVLRLMQDAGHHRLNRIAGVALPSVALAGGAAALMAQLSVFSWIGYQFADDRFASNYVDPARVALRVGATKNLVLIYLESMEETYGDEKLWGRDLLGPLRGVGGVSFANYRPAPGATWTIAAMVATQCGVPLRVVSQHGVKARSADGRAFLPGATCLGDILQRQGYRNVFLGGAPLSFSGKGSFLHDHHYQQAYGREQWQAEGVDSQAIGEWGLFDDELYARAKVKLAQLHASGQRFNLTLLTLDTHNPNGFRSPQCKKLGLQDFQGIVECSSRQTADFIRFIRASGYLKDTNVVVLGDHLAVSNPVYDTLRKSTNRRIFNLFVSQTAPQKNTEELLPFDLFPSILAFIGIDAAGDRLGLGYSAFNPPEVARPSSHAAELELPSLGGSASYGRLWDAQ